MNKQLADEVARWHLNNGGYCDTPEVYKYHTLRLLHEAVELCLASGANDLMVSDVLDEEINKHKARYGDHTVISMDDISGEIADVAILLELFAGCVEVDIDLAVQDKLDILHQRQWEPDIHGVLWRQRSGEEEPPP
ncbi:hypothetical protein LCGC14_1733370 [marine sediment metagenome]|uniref:Uncharacterized protein n=1 Tax=marine sediment metagenome TaxID=412755 RepID=A0A0F9JPB0_9ZZZZ